MAVECNSSLVEANRDFHGLIMFYATYATSSSDRHGQRERRLVGCERERARSNISEVMEEDATVELKQNSK